MYQQLSVLHGQSKPGADIDVHVADATRFMLLNTLTIAFSFIEANSKDPIPPRGFPLPTEIMAYIFNILVQASADDTHVYDWTKVTHVCRFWRESALRTPSLWASISTRNLDAAFTFLERSCVAPLSIYICHPTHPGEHYRNMVFFWQSFLQNCYRVREFDFTCPSCTVCKMFGHSYPYLQHFLNHPAPLLERLVFDLNFYVTPQYIPSNFGGEFPSLRQVTLINFINLGPHNSINNLTRLVLTHQLDCNPALMDIVDLLEANPLLEDIFLAAGTPPTTYVEDRIFHPTPGRIIHLNKLRRFSMTNYGSHSIKGLLYSLVLPNTAALRFISPVLGAGDDFHALIPRDVSRLGCWGTVSTLLVKFIDNGHVDIAGFDLVAGFTVEHVPTILLDSIARFVPMKAVRQLWLGGVQRNEEIIRVEQLLRSATSATKLVFLGGSELHDLEGLGRTIPRNLVEIWLDGRQDGTDIGSLRNFIAARDRSGNPVSLKLGDCSSQVDDLFRGSVECIGGVKLSLPDIFVTNDKYWSIVKL